MVQQTPSQQPGSLQDPLNHLRQLMSHLPQTAQQADQVAQAFEKLQAWILQAKMVEERRYQAEQAFRCAIEASMTAGVIAIDLAGQQTYANDRFCEMVEWEATELVGEVLPFVFWPPQELEHISQVFQSILKGELAPHGVELSFQRRNGQTFQAHLLASPHRSSENTIVGWVISVEDITERKATEAALRQSEARFQRLISNMPGMVYRYLPCAGDADAFNYVNSGSQELFEVDPDQVLESANSIWKLIHPDDFQSLQDSIAFAVAHSLPWAWEGRIITPSGQIKWIQGRSRPEQTIYGEVWDGLLIDITDRKQTEERLKRSLQEKEVLLQEINHRVKNNLQIVSSLLNIQASHLTDQAAQEALRNSRSRIESMALVHDNLYRSQNLASIRFSEYVQTQITHLFKTYNLQQENFTLHVDINSNLVLDLDQAISCGLILNELITNALQHSFDPGSTGEIFIHAQTTSDQVMTLTVGNTGDNLPENFDLQTVQSMGLKLVTTLVKQLRGTVTVHRGAYTEFIMTLPYTKKF